MNDLEAFEEKKRFHASEALEGWKLIGSDPGHHQTFAAQNIFGCVV